MTLFYICSTQEYSNKMTESGNGCSLVYATRTCSLSSTRTVERIIWLCAWSLTCLNSADTSEPLLLVGDSTLCVLGLSGLAPLMGDLHRYRYCVI